MLQQQPNIQTVLPTLHDETSSRRQQSMRIFIWLRHPRKELAALALKPGWAKALRRHLRMFWETSLKFIIIARTYPQKWSNRQITCEPIQKYFNHNSYTNQNKTKVQHTNNRANNTRESLRDPFKIMHTAEPNQVQMEIPALTKPQR